MRPVLLVVGAARHSLGEAVAAQAEENWDYDLVQTAGITDESLRLDVRVNESIKTVLEEVRPDYVVCTVGVNIPAGIGHTFLPTLMQDSFHTNVVGPLTLLQHFVTMTSLSVLTRKFVVISSNSAHIARSGSLPYCASKAALSMGLRVAARDLADNPGILAWGYEPGLLGGTPMTRVTQEQFSGPLHRMKGVGPGGLSPYALADRVLSDLSLSGLGLHGTMFRFDAGEQ